jgi:electron transport complex protein RnfD
MRQVILALLPVTAASVYFFGLKAVFIILNCLITALVTEILILKIRRKEMSQVFDSSAALTGLLLALILPPSTSWYAASLGSVFAILVGKHIFGGLGANIFNPALIGRAFLMAAYPKMLTTFDAPLKWLILKPSQWDSLSSATPLALRKFSQTITLNTDLFIGNVSGSLGETSALLLLLGGSYILIRKIADWRIPLSILFTVSSVAAIFYWLNPLNASVLFHLFSGGLLLGVLFMATDPVTTPVTKKGRYIFGIGTGLIIMVIRYFSGLPEGVMYAILFMNAFVPLINRYTKPKPFGR